LIGGICAGGRSYAIAKFPEVLHRTAAKGAAVGKDVAVFIEALCGGIDSKK
jgi:hypothetical protein